MRPGDLHPNGYVFFGIFILAFIVLIVLFQIVRKRPNNVYFKIWRGLNSFAITNLIIALFLMFFESETLYLLGARFWLLLWLVSMAVWLYFILIHLKKIPEIKEQFKKEQEYKKYIP